jgi:hypothetical protein
MSLINSNCSEEQKALSNQVGVITRKIQALSREYIVNDVYIAELIETNKMLELLARICDNLESSDMSTAERESLKQQEAELREDCAARMERYKNT